MNSSSGPREMLQVIRIFILSTSTTSRLYARKAAHQISEVVRYVRFTLSIGRNISEGSTRFMNPGLTIYVFNNTSTGSALRHIFTSTFCVARLKHTRSPKTLMQGPNEFLVEAMVQEAEAALRVQENARMEKRDTDEQHIGEEQGTKSTKLG
jgi:hypothetical protein